MSSLDPSSGTSVPDTIEGVNESASHPSHIEGRATPDPTPYIPFDWRRALQSIDEANANDWKERATTTDVLHWIAAHQLAELLNFLNRIQIPAWLLKKK